MDRSRRAPFLPLRSPRAFGKWDQKAPSARHHRFSFSVSSSVFESHRHSDWHVSLEVLLCQPSLLSPDLIMEFQCRRCLHQLSEVREVRISEACGPPEYDRLEAWRGESTHGFSSFSETLSCILRISNNVFRHLVLQRISLTLQIYEPSNELHLFCPDVFILEINDGEEHNTTEP